MLYKKSTGSYMHRCDFIYILGRINLTGKMGRDLKNSKFNQKLWHVCFLFTFQSKFTKFESVSSHEIDFLLTCCSYFVLFNFAYFKLCKSQRSPSNKSGVIRFISWWPLNGCVYTRAQNSTEYEYLNSLYFIVYTIKEISF